MKKFSFIMLVLLVKYTAYSQSEYGILVKTTLFPSKGWYGSHAGVQRITVGSKTISKTSNPELTFKIEYDYITIDDQPSTIHCTSRTSGNRDNTDCGPIEKNISYNKSTFTKSTFYGCIADSEIYGIHIIRKDANSNKCPDDVIELTNGWNWQYSFDGTNWIDFAANFQEQRGISFKIKELAGFENKTKVYFQAGFGTQFTNILPFDISPCTPKILSTSAPNLTKCSYSKDGAVTFTFGRELQYGEQYEMALLYENGRVLLDGNKTIPKDSMTTPTTYTWNNLEAENYQLTYYVTKKVGTTVYPNSPALRNSFTISPAPELQFSVSGVNPLCHNDTVELVIHVTGGTGPYRFYLDNIEKFPVQEADGFYHLTNLTPKSYEVKVTDANNCIDTN